MDPHHTEFSGKESAPHNIRKNERGGSRRPVSYGVNVPDLYRRAAPYVDKVLTGPKPADLPVEQPTKFEFVINLKTAKQIGLTIPPNVLTRGNRSESGKPFRIDPRATLLPRLLCYNFARTICHYVYESVRSTG
jgi:ABC transporter substrate binding protein